MSTSFSGSLQLLSTLFVFYYTDFMANKIKYVCMYVCTHYRIVLEARARPGRQCCVKGHDRQKRKASESRLTDEVVESMLAEQVSAVEFVAGSQRSEAAWIAVELTSNSERTQLLHAALF